MILRQHHRHELRERFPAALPPLAHLLLEHVDAILIGNRHVERRIHPRRTIEQRLRQREADSHPDAGFLEHLLLERSGHLGAEAEVVERHAIAREMLPQRARLVVVLREHGRGGAGDVAPAGRRAEQPCFDPRPRVHFDPFVGIHANHPPMTGVRLIAVAVKVVEQYKSIRQRLMVRRYMTAELRQRCVPIHPRPLAVDLVERPVLLDDEDDVFDGRGGLVARRWVTRVDVVDGAFRLHRELAFVGDGDDLQRALHHIDGGGALRRVYESAASIRAGAQPFRAADDESAIVVRERHHGRKPAGRKVPGKLLVREIDDRHRIQAGAGDIKARFVGADRHAERQHAAQMLQTCHRQCDLRQVRAAGGVDDRDGVVRGVRHIYASAAHD